MAPHIVGFQSINQSIRYFERQTRQFNDNDRLKYKSTVSPRIDAFLNSFFPRTVTQWNSLPYNIRDIVSVDQFKAELKEYVWLVAREDLNKT